MQPEEKQRLLKYLQDALSAAHEIERNTLGLGPHNFYFSNIRWLVERGIEIVSEALKRASSIEPDLPISEIKKSSLPRNKIAHGMILLILFSSIISPAKTYQF